MYHPNPPLYPGLDGGLTLGEWHWHVPPKPSSLPGAGWGVDTRRMALACTTQTLYPGLDGGLTLGEWHWHVPPKPSSLPLFNLVLPTTATGYNAAVPGHDLGKTHTMAASFLSAVCR